METQSNPSESRASSLLGIKVIELASVLAGPSAGMFLAELGAEVIKIERPGEGVSAGDVTRTWKLPGEADGISAYYASANWGKSVRYLDLRNSQEELNNLLSDADILLTNFKSSSAERLNLRSEDIARRYPKLIHARLTGYPDGETSCLRPGDPGRVGALCI